VNTIYNVQSKHLIAVDCVIFGYEDEELKLLLFHRELEPSRGKWSLVGGWMQERESAEDAAIRVLQKITGLKNIFMEQVVVFSEPDRDPGGHVVSIVFNALIDIKKHNKDLVREHGAHWWPISKLPALIFDHDLMLEKALAQLQAKASFNLVGGELLPEEFTIIQLRKLYNSIFQREFDPGNFRKKILSLNVLERLNKKDVSESKKGAFYYRLKPEAEKELNERIVKL
jgi:ADP-ribose pyrophosphatase YjhB (NUDIX family)